MLCLLFADSVIILQNDNVAATKRFDAIRCPFAASNSRRAVVEGSDIVGVSLALAKENCRVGILQQFRPAVENATLANAGIPLAIAIRSANAEALRLVSQNLVEQSAVCVFVRISRNE